MASPGRIARKSRLSVSCAISPSAPASSTPVGPPPTTTNVIHSRRRVRIGFALGGLEGDQDPPADLGRVLDRLEPRREGGPLAGGRSTSGGRRSRRSACRTRSARRRRSAPRDDPGRARPPGRGSRSCCAACAARSEAAGRCRRARARRSRPGRAAAGTGGSCAGRRGSGGPPDRSRGCARRRARRTRHPTIVTRCGSGRVSRELGHVVGF